MAMGTGRALRQLKPGRLNTEELLGLAAECRTLQQEYEARALPVPEWLSWGRQVLDTELDARRTELLKKQLAAAGVYRVAALRDADRCRVIDDEIAQLRTQLQGRA